MPDLRYRVSLQQIQDEYDDGHKAPLETLIRAFRGIQDRDPDYSKSPEEDLSYFRIAGFHGEPFEGPGKYDASWWGGYCHHSDVLFPLWHRAYLLHLEKALQSIDGCENVMLPFWDETWTALNDPEADPLPWVLTRPKFRVDGVEVDNPLYSYKLTAALAYDVTGSKHRYSKPKGYRTVRYPLSGLVGTSEDLAATLRHNEKHSETAIRSLNDNVRAWLTGTVQIDKSDDPDETRYADTYSIKSRYLKCLDAPSYTVFSNNTSARHYLEQSGKTTSSGALDDVVAIESPHNALHLAMGGFYKEASYNANPIRGANGDVGANETAAFEPAFFLHHVFCDYVFWQWQRRYGCTNGLSIDANDPGARSEEGSVGTAPGSPLGMSTFLPPFHYTDKENESVWRTGDSLVNIETQLGYTYGSGSLDSPDLFLGLPIQDSPSLDSQTGISSQVDIAPRHQSHFDAALLSPPPSPTILSTSVSTRLATNTQPPFTRLLSTPPISRTLYPGSFVIHTYASTPRRGPIKIGREPILSRWNLKNCKTCQGRLTVKGLTVVTAELESALLAGEKTGTAIEWFARVESLTESENGPETAFGRKTEVFDVRDREEKTIAEKDRSRYLHSNQPSQWISWIGNQTRARL